MFHIKLDQFEGPFEALLQLIQGEKLNISEVSLSTVADQFLSQLRAQEGEFDPDALADFLVVAAKLLLLKVRQLLPYLSGPEEEEALSLVEQLKLYEAFAQKSRYLMTRVATREFIYGGAERLVIARVFRPAKNLTVANLKNAWSELLSFQKEQEALKLPEVKVQKVITLEECLAHLEKLVQAQARLKFSDLANSSERLNIIVHFLAVLELLKNKVIMASQSEHFEEIHLSKF